MKTRDEVYEPEVRNQRIEQCIDILVAGAKNKADNPVTRCVGSPCEWTDNRLGLSTVTYGDNNSVSMVLNDLVSAGYNTGVIATALHKIHESKKAYVDCKGFNVSDVQSIQLHLDNVYKVRGISFANSAIEHKGSIYVRDLSVKRSASGTGSKRVVTTPSWLKQIIEHPKDDTTQEDTKPIHNSV